MGLRDELIEVLTGYAQARDETFTGHPLAHKVRATLPATVRSVLPTEDNLILVKGSAGQGNWVRGPWVAVFNRMVTESAQRGFYPVYLFAEDLSGVYLSLNQAMTEAKERYQADARTALQARAENFRAMLGPNVQPFSFEPINLSPSSRTNDTAFYEEGNICAVFYSAQDIPAETVLIAHLIRVLDLYERLLEAGAADEQINQAEIESFFEGGARARVHLRIERNRRLIKRVKDSKGCQCECCEMEYSQQYGELGVGYIEAHHLVPLAKLRGRAIALDPVKDFAVLCANCHRMAHRMDDPADIEGLRAIVAAARDKNPQ